MNLALPEPRPRSGLYRKIALAVILLLIALAGVYWHFSGLIHLTGQVSGSVVSLSAEISGKISQVTVEPGDQVQAGQDLILLEQTELERQYAVELQRLDAIEASLPPGALSGNYMASDSAAGRLELARQDEQQAERRLSEISTEEARLAVALRRAMILKAQGMINEVQYQETLLAHTQAERELSLARMVRERAALARTEAESGLRREHEIRRTPGMDAESVNLRLQQYQEQLTRTQEVFFALTASTVVSPGSGRIREVAVGSGDLVQAGQSLIIMQLLDTEPMILAPLPLDAVEKLTVPGQSCGITFPGLSEDVFKGRVEAVLLYPSGSAQDAPFPEDGLTPGDAGSATVQIALLPGQNIPELTENVQADITVYLRETVEDENAGSGLAGAS